VGSAARDQLLEAVDIALAGRDVQPVRAPVRLAPAVPAQHLPQPRHLVVQHLVRRRRRRLPPQLLHQPVALEQLAGPDNQQTQQRTLPPPSQSQARPVIADDFNSAAHSKVQGTTLTPPIAAPQPTNGQP
jgi:hypothetical protein